MDGWMDRMKEERKYGCMEGSKEGRMDGKRYYG